MITQLLARRARAGWGAWSTTRLAGCGWSTSCPRARSSASAPGLLTETRGTGILHHVFHGYEPRHGELRTRPTGAQPRRGPAALPARPALPGNLQERGQLFVRPGVEVYEGIDRRRTPRRSRRRDEGAEAHEHALVLGRRACPTDPPRLTSLEQALEFGRRRRVRRGHAGERQAWKLQLSAQKRQTAAPRKARGSARSSRLPLRVPAAAPGVHELGGRAQAGFLVLLAVPEPAGDARASACWLGERK